MSFDDNRHLWRQLPGDTWHAPAGEQTPFEAARQVISSGMDAAIESETLPAWSETFVRHTLDAIITQQSVRNGQIMELQPIDNPDWDQMVDGSAWPNQLVRLKKKLGSAAVGKGIEMARHTHIGIWDTEDVIDAPVRRDLVNARDLDTWLIEGQPYYKLKYTDKDGNGEIIERKRLVATHNGSPYEGSETLWTIRRDMMLIDFIAIKELIKGSDDGRSNGLSSEQLDAHRLMYSIKKATSNAENRNYNMRTARMNTVLEPIIDKPIDLRPGYIRPLLTTYYLKDATSKLSFDDQLTLF